MLNRKNLVIIGVLLLLIFGVAIGLIGKKIDATANEMHNAMLEEVGRYRSELLALDFRKTIGLANSVRDYITKNTFHEKELQDLLCGLVRLDAKVSRIWYRYRKESFTCIDSTGLIQVDPVVERTLIKLTEDLKGKRKNGLYYSDGVLYWSLCAQSHDVAFGLDISLPDLHTYFAGMDPGVKSYAYVLNGEGIHIVHPDEHKIGRKLTDPQAIGILHEVLRNNKVIHNDGFSEFLLLAVKRVYYPITVGRERWVVVINVPELVIEEEMHDFHRYTLMIAIFTVILFSILLAFSQYKWRKEYDRRRKFEQEALQLNLQQLKNQINPHFLFNALNSLSALIGKEPALAKEFVLKLSKIYRYVLENRNENLVTVRDEIAFVRHYYFLQKIRFAGQLVVDIQDDLEKEERFIPLMSLQTLIENAIKHNEITHQHPLKIHIYEKDDCLIVENSFCPRTDESTESLGIGIENIRKIYLYCSSLEFSYFVENGKFICVLPLI